MRVRWVIEENTDGAAARGYPVSLALVDCRSVDEARALAGQSEAPPLRWKPAPADWRYAIEVSQFYEDEGWSRDA